MRSQIVLLATIGTTIAQFGRVVNRNRTGLVYGWAKILISTEKKVLKIL